jgi:hypothetical protein
MLIAGRTLALRQLLAGMLSLEVRRRGKLLSAALLVLWSAVLGSSGCGTSATTVTSPAAGKVNSYFGGPFSTTGSNLAQSSSTFDHTANQIGVSAFISTKSAQVPAPIINGTFTAADTGFLSITENFATTSTGVIAPQNPPLAGAWAVEIPGAGALVNLLVLNGAGAALPVGAAPSAMVQNAACPDFPKEAPFLYVTVPRTSLNRDNADYGSVNISTQGSFVTFKAMPFLIGAGSQTASTVTGGCSNTNLGALTAYPLNSFGATSSLELIGIGSSGLLVSSLAISTSGDLGAFGGGTGVIGVAEPSAPVDVNAVIGAKYNGFVYSPLNGVHQSYDITALASSFGDDSATSQACSALQASLAANNGQGARTVPVLPSANSLYGGEFLSNTSSGTINNPSGASGSEDCDLAIDLGTQDSTTNGLFPNATVFVGSNFPPYSASNPWLCSDTGTICAVSFPAAAVVGQVQGQYVIFLAASASSTPAARLPDSFGNRQAQPVGIYLFQKQ